MASDKKDKKKSSKKSAKEAYQNYVKQVKANRFARKKTLKEFTTKLTNLKLEYKKNLAATNDKKQKVSIKTKYKNDKFNLENERDYALAKLNIGQKTRDKKKMKVDKRIAFKNYDVKKRQVILQNKQNEKSINKSFSEKKSSLRHDVFSYLRSNPKKDEKFQEQMNLFKSKKIDQINYYETQIRNNKIWYKNTIRQLQQVRDLSYQYELDTFFLLKRWYYGVGKEFQRMSWPSGKKTLKDFLVVVSVSAIIIVLFLILDLAFNAF